MTSFKKRDIRSPPPFVNSVNLKKLDVIYERPLLENSIFKVKMSLQSHENIVLIKRLKEVEQKLI